MHITQLPPFVCDLPGHTSCMQLPVFRDGIECISIVNRSPESVDRIKVRIGNVLLVDIGKYQDTDTGLEVTAGQTIAMLAALEGPQNPLEALTLSFRPGLLVVPPEIPTFLELQLSMAADPTKRTLAFVKTRALAPV